jgi:uncharacterized protein DUF4141
MSRACCVCLLLAATVMPAHAQFAVIDPANLAQAILIAERTWQHYEELRREFETIRRMAEGLGDLDRFRTPPIVATQHDPGRWKYGGTWLEGLNTGDPFGVAYRSTILPLEPIDRVPIGLSPQARRMLERQYSSVEITDAAAQMGGHQVSLVRRYHDPLARAVAALESDVLNRRPEYHEMTAVLDEIAAGELLARRQDTAANQLLSYALEQLLARGKSLRDTEAAAINMQLGTWRDAHDANKAFVLGTGDALRTWRQP